MKLVTRRQNHKFAPAALVHADTTNIADPHLPQIIKHPQQPRGSADARNGINVPILDPYLPLPGIANQVERDKPGWSRWPRLASLAAA